MVKLVFINQETYMYLMPTTQSKNGLDKMTGFVSIYVTPDTKINIILNFDKVNPTNFIPRNNYGVNIN